MTATSKAVIKGYFETGDTPTGAQFSDLIDSYQDANVVLTYMSTAAQTATSGRFIAANGTGGVAFVSADRMNYQNGTLTVGADIDVSGAATFRNTMSVSGAAIFKSNVSVSGALSVSGAFNAGKVTDYHSLYVETVSARTYDWVKSSPYAFTLQGIRRIANAGESTIDIQKNGISLATYSASTAAVSAALSASFVQGDNLTLVTTSVSACTGLSVYGQITRVL